ncbi:MAG: hypothetical protein EOO48_01635 [Flavobacterium sp.]|nr:MAG: hypothetical protein EOO48_01635 [Flavobacterium sp.]
MRQFTVLCLLFLFKISSAQTEKRHFAYVDAKLETVISDIESKFDIKYSYADSIVSPTKFTLKEGDYTLPQLNFEIENQTQLSVVKISDRYYSIYRSAMRSEQLEEIVVTGFLSKGISKSAQQFLISPKKVKELPGVTDADVLFSLQQLPGVKSPNETASGLHVRGGTPDQNLILWDGIRMYHPGHLFGMISAFNPNIDQIVHYYNKGTDPKFGERVSGIISIQTTDKISDSLNVDAGINGLCADVYAKIPIAKTIGLQLSARKSYTESVQTPTFNALADKVFQNTDFDDFGNGSEFGFQDYSAKINWQPDSSNSFSATGILIDNHLDFNAKQLDDSTISQNLKIGNLGSSLRWNHKYRFGLTQEMLLHYSGYDFDYQNQRRFSQNEFSTFTKMNRVVDSGIELDLTYPIAERLKTHFGYQLSGNDISHSFNSISQGLNVELDQKHRKNISHSGYGNLKYNAAGWNFLAGLRYNEFAQLHQTSAEPRAFVQKTIGRYFTVQTSYERKTQILSQIRESVANDLSLENYVWVLADGNEYPVQKSNQYSAGFTFKSKSFLVDADAYYKTIGGITSLAFGFLHQYDSQIRQGKGFTKGVDLLVQKSAPTWRVWATYTYQDSQNKYDELNDGDYFPISSDTKHAFSISCHKQWNRFSASAGWFWHTGKPYSLINSSNDISSFNSERLPVYHRLDMSAAYEFHQNKKWNGKAGFSILNLYDRHSVISKEYERQYVTIGDIIHSNYVVRNYQSLGFTPNLFVRFGF